MLGFPPVFSVFLPFPSSQTCSETQPRPPRPPQGSFLPQPPMLQEPQTRQHPKARQRLTLRPRRTTLDPPTPGSSSVHVRNYNTQHVLRNTTFGEALAAGNRQGEPVPLPHLPGHETPLLGAGGTRKRGTLQAHLPPVGDSLRCCSNPPPHPPDFTERAKGAAGTGDSRVSPFRPRRVCKPEVALEWRALPNHMPGNCTAHGSFLSRERTYPRSGPPNTRDNAVKIFGSAMGGPHFGHRAWHQGPLGDLSHRAGPSLQEGKVTAADRASAQGTAQKGLGHCQAAQCSSPESARASPRRGEEGFEHSAPSAVHQACFP